MAIAILSPLEDVSDEQLLARFRGGDREALEELFRRYRLVCYRVAYRLLGREADALDAVQEGFVKALTHLDGFEGRSSFKTWLLRVVSNAALDWGRQRGRRTAMSLHALDGADQEDEALVITEHPTRRLEQEEARRLLRRALGKLSEAHRRTFVLHVDGELNYREVAEILGISIGTVMSRLYYARQKLRTYLARWINND